MLHVLEGVLGHDDIELILEPEGGEVGHTKLDLAWRLGMHVLGRPVDPGAVEIQREHLGSPRGEVEGQGTVSAPEVENALSRYLRSGPEASPELGRRVLALVLKVARMVLWHRLLLCQGQRCGWRVAVDGHGWSGPFVRGLRE